jgi:hypothetical protein
MWHKSQKIIMQQPCHCRLFRNQANQNTHKPRFSKPITYEDRRPDTELDDATDRQGFQKDNRVVAEITHAPDLIHQEIVYPLKLTKCIQTTTEDVLNNNRAPHEMGDQ